jgi:hypothetical protein
MHAHHSMELQRHHLPQVHHQGYQDQLQDLSEDPREAEKMNQSHLLLEQADASLI